MLLAIPMTLGKIFSVDVMEGIHRQTLSISLLCISMPENRDRRTGEAACRNELSKYLNGEYCVIMDSDVVMTSDTDISDALKYLKNNPDLDGCLHDIKPWAFNGHQTIGWGMYRTEQIKSIVFVPSDHCLCEQVSIKLNLKYVDGRKLKELPRK